MLPPFIEGPDGRGLHKSKSISKQRQAQRKSVYVSVCVVCMMCSGRKHTRLPRTLIGDMRPSESEKSACKTRRQGPSSGECGQLRLGKVNRSGEGRGTQRQGGLTGAWLMRALGGTSWASPVLPKPRHSCAVKHKHSTVTWWVVGKPRGGRAPWGQP